MNEPKVTLIASTPDPIKVLYEVWQCSKYEKTIEEVRADYEQAQRMRVASNTTPPWTDEFPDPMALFETIIESTIPVMENIDLLFLLENVSISFREQMVRHRIGVNVGERLGCDLAPDIADSVWWSQSMRILDMGKFASKEHYFVPASILKNEIALRMLQCHMLATEELYTKFVEMGIPMEEAREVIPVGATHAISWKLNIASLKHIIGKRSCWILQLGYWGPIIKGMVDELVHKVHPVFAKLVTPPCIKREQFVGCPHTAEHTRRFSGADSLPPCSLYVHNVSKQPVVEPPNRSWTMEQYLAKREAYRDFWHRDPDSGRLK